MSVEGIKVDDLHKQVASTVPRSPEERKVLEAVRQRREQKTDEFRVIRNNALEQSAENGVIEPRAAQHAGQVAIEQVTGEHEIPVEVIHNPGTMH